MIRPRAARLRILMTADAVGGVWSYALDLARASEPHRTEFILATMGPAPSADQIDEARRIPNLRLHVSQFRLEWMSDPWDDVDAAGRWLLSLEARERPDIIHLNGFSHGALPFRAPALIVAHSCCLSWWRAVKGEEAPAAWDTYRRRVRAGLDGAAATVAPTRAMLDEFTRLHGPLPAPRVIHNAARAPAAILLSKSEMILAAGRLWDEAKNISILSRIAPSLPWPVHVAGALDGPLGAGPDPSRLITLGRLPRGQMASALARAAIYAHPALYEPFGLLPLEAALARCTLVLGDIPTLRELWDGAAAFADPRDPADLQHQLRAVIADPARRLALATTARRRALRLSLTRLGRDYADLYSSLSRHAPPPSTGAPDPCESHCSTTPC